MIDRDEYTTEFEATDFDLKLDKEKAEATLILVDIDGNANTFTFDAPMLDDLAESITNQKK